MRFLTLDVFTSTPLTGNQLAVFPDGAEVPEAIRQDLAREVGYSETVYCDPPSHPTAGDVRARIFTPSVELPFAGHPVLGTAVAVARERGLPGGSVVTLECRVGPVPVELDDACTGGWMRQPVPTITPFAAADVDVLLAALHLERDDLVAPIDTYDNGLVHVMVTVQPGKGRTALPDLTRLHAIVGLATVSVAEATGPETATTRVFVPSAGIVEDPATGSAAGPLGIHLLRHGIVEPGRPLTVTQGVEIQRPSTLLVRVEGLPDAIASVAVGGSAVVVAEGRYTF